jgi:glutathione synthase/RimK-type ligase-like ATP-grasp enzyme
MEQPIVLITDHASEEGSREYLAETVEHCTGERPVCLDARNFLPGAGGRVEPVPEGLRIVAPLEGRAVVPSVVIVYEIPPDMRNDFAEFQRSLGRQGGKGPVTLGLDPEAWRTATEKDLTVERFLRDGIPHMETVTFDGPRPEHALAEFHRLGGNVWARPLVGMCGTDVFHITDDDALLRAAEHYGSSGVKWQICRDALNFDERGDRHQFRILVLDGEAIQVCEHVQSEPDSPCNESQGAAVTILEPERWPAELCRLAVAATRSVGLRFSGVDLALESGGVVFEVNVHPGFGPGPFHETTALPYVRAHLEEAAKQPLR